MKHLLTILFSFAALSLSAQTDVGATVVDSTGQELPGANVVLLRASDSLLTAFGTADANGKVLLEDVAAGNYLLRVTFLGFERPDQPLEITAKDQFLGLGDLRMYPAGFFLDGVSVTADRIPIRMVGDTMMYDAEAFGVGENAVVEDLLRRLPGMTVNGAGEITWNGRPVSEVMINGKPFFGGNTTLLTQNLDAKAVKNVQVFDQKTDQEEITGRDDGNENITVNLETKEEFKAKVFGDVYGGYGTQDRYQAGGKGFRISDKTQWGVLGTINNINKVGFTGDEISGFSAASGRGRGFSWRGNNADGLLLDDGNATGQNRSLAAGLNFGRSLGKDGQFTANYGLFDRDQVQRSSLLETFNRRGERRVVNTDETNAAQSYQHNVGFELRQKVDSVGRLRVRGEFQVNGFDNQDFSTTEIKSGNAAEEDYTVDNLNDSERMRGNLRLGYNTALSRKENAPTAYVRLRGNVVDDRRDVVLTTAGLEGGLALPGALVNGRQTQERLTDEYGYEGGAGIEFALNDKWRLEPSFEYELQHETGDYRFRLEEATTDNLLERGWRRIRPSLELTRDYGRGSAISVGANYVNARLDVTGDAQRRSDYNVVLPYASLRKRLEKGFMGAWFRSDLRAPGVNQLQTIAEPNVSGRVSVGNEALEPASDYSLNTYVGINDQFKAIGFNFNGGGSYVDNAFGNALTFAEGQQVFQTINVSHSWNYWANPNFNIGVNKLKGQLNFGPRLNGSAGPGFVDGISRQNRSITYGGNVSFNTEINEDSYVTLSYDYNNFRNAFDGEEASVTTQQSHNIGVDFALEIVRWWRFETRFFYAIFPATEFAPRQEIPDLRAQLELRPFQKKGHYFRLSASDVFNQNQVISRRVGEFSTTERRADALGFYVLGTFFYKF